MNARPSYWELDAFFRPYDVVITGSGLVGLNAAITLLERHPGLRVAIIERGTIPLGASTRNAGFACFGSLSEILDDIQHTDEDSAIALVVKRFKGLQKLLERVRKDRINYEPTGGAEVFLAEDQDHFEACFDIMPRLNARLRETFGANPFIRIDNKLSEHGITNARHLVWHPFEGQLHPGLLIQQLIYKARDLGAVIFNGVHISDIQSDANGVRLLTTSGQEIQGRVGLVATNGFAQQLLPELKVKPARNQVFVTNEIPGLKLNGCFHYNEGYVYFRNIGKRVLIGGARHIDLEAEYTDEFGLTENIREWLAHFLDQYVLLDVDWKAETEWSGIMGVGTIKEPIVRPVADQLIAAVRLGGMGVAIGALVGDEAAEEVLRHL